MANTTGEYKNIDDFITLFNEFKEIRQQQKMRGLNDFNIFTTLRGGSSDEVRLHSRFLAFLLDPNENHYQGTLFLELFLQEIGLSSFFIDLENCTVYAEYENIDIYITNGNKHIIIENKIWAGDQHAQIKRYIETINKENEDLTNDDMVVVYLSVNRKKPSNYSLCQDEKDCPNGFKIKNKKIIGKGINQDKEYHFLNLHYNNQIAKWLNKAYAQVKNITNLSVILEQYQEVLLQLYGKYKEKVMDLDEYLTQKAKEGESKKDLLYSMYEISDTYIKYRKNKIKEFFNDSVKELGKKLENYPEWEVIFNKDIINKGQRYKAPISIRQVSKNNKIFFGFEFDNTDYYDCYFGIKRQNNKINFDDNFFNQFAKELNKQNFKKSSWWLGWKWYYKDDFLDKIIDDDFKVDNFVNDFMELFTSYKEIVINCNNYLDK